MRVPGRQCQHIISGVPSLTRWCIYTRRLADSPSRARLSYTRITADWEHTKPVWYWSFVKLSDIYPSSYSLFGSHHSPTTSLNCPLTQATRYAFLIKARCARFPRRHHTRSAPFTVRTSSACSIAYSNRRSRIDVGKDKRKLNPPQRTNRTISWHTWVMVHPIFGI